MSDLKREGRIVAAAIRYAAATSKIRTLTKRLADFEDDGSSSIRCFHPQREQDGVNCRKWTYEPEEESACGRGGWYSHRDREEWCHGCAEIQRIVDERRAARRERAAALSAIGNIARACIREREESNV